jgi:cytidylate kinase
VRPRGPVIALDGPSGAGKSSAGKALAARLNYVYVDTGAMYRALALKAIREGLDLRAEAPLLALLRDSTIELVAGEAGRVRLDGADVSLAIRSPEISAAASQVSVHPQVRREMVARQKVLGEQGGIVMDGRDIGTKVFPDAELKFYVDADPKMRARRRHAELTEAGASVSVEEVERDLRERDQADSNRSESPLTRAEDAVLIDTTALTQEGVIEALLAAFDRKGRRAANPESAGLV